MRKIKINPKYEYLRAFLESIPDIFEKEGRVIYTGRNLIKVLTAPDGTQVNVNTTWTKQTHLFLEYQKAKRSTSIRISYDSEKKRNQYS